MVALTHVHPDHQGCAKAVCEARGVPLACHADDVDAMEGRRPVAATTNPAPSSSRGCGRARPTRSTGCCRRATRSPASASSTPPATRRGEVIFFRDSDRVAICGDVIRNITYVDDCGPSCRAARRPHPRPGREPPLDPQARRAEPLADPPRPRPRRDRHRRLRALRLRPARLAAAGASSEHAPCSGCTIPSHDIRRHSNLSSDCWHPHAPGVTRVALS